jgi:hypothetical protein
VAVTDDDPLAAFSDPVPKRCVALLHHIVSEGINRDTLEPTVTVELSAAEGFWRFSLTPAGADDLAEWLHDRAAKARSLRAEPDDAG